ncbi:hypothetical protein [Terrimonas ferruginea]|uniref:hypothetical protein n=1 Tax=Terrimonas ferruginea TaxID=249 RepID=UPI000419D82D|nr:hypothetical protein [Terrimonas ferruginea]
MKFVGFIAEHAKDPFAQKRSYYFKEKDINPNKDDVLAYLKRGELCVPLMGGAEDVDEEMIGLISIYTDGEWLWPKYFINYLEKYPNFKIEEEFVQHVLKNRAKEVTVTEEEVSKLEKEFYRIAGFK